jgi:hypothetical protein
MNLAPTAPLAIGVVALALLGGACSSPSKTPTVASVGSTTTSARSASSDDKGNKGDPVAFSRCMRAHGVKDFPDPNSDGGIAIQAGPGSDLDRNNATFKAAQQACRGLEPRPSSAQRKAMNAAMLKFAKCMRSHGIKDFPDPQADGGLTIGAKAGSDLDPNSPTFKAAQQACQKYMPGGKGAPGGFSTQTAGGK